MKKIKLIFKPFIIVIVVIILLFSFINFVKQTNNLNTNAVLEHLEDVGKQEANSFNQQFENFKNIIISTSNLIGNSFKSKEDIGNILDNIRMEKNYFQRLWYVDENRKLNNYKYDDVFESKNSFVDEIFKGNTGITDVFESSYNQKNIVTIYAPVYSNNKVVGGIAGVIEINKENNDFVYNDVFNDKAYVFTTSVNGKIISKIKNENTIYNGDNYFEFLNDKKMTYLKGNYDEVLHNIEKQQPGFLEYTYENNERMVYYTPVKINNWYTFTVVTTDIIGERNDSINNITIMLVIEILFVIGILFVFVIKYYIKINKINNETTKRLKASNRKIDMVLKQISDRIFEYDIVNDSMILDAWNDNPKIILNHFLSNIHNYNFVSKEEEKLLIEKFELIGKNNNKIDFDAKLPYISKDYETWYHISMIYDDQSKHAVGTLKNSTKEMNEYLELLQDSIFKNSIYSHALFMFAVNMGNKKVVIYQKNGTYNKMIDVDYNEYLVDYLMKSVHLGDKEKVKKFFDYENIKSIYFDKKKKSKIEYRHLNEETNEYMWIRCRVQFERKNSNNELLIIVYAADIDEEKKKQLEIEFMAKRDGLTSLYNRQTFNQMVNNYLKKKNSLSNYCAYMIIDLDNFKNINDKLGHSVGDKVLKKVSKILGSVFESNGYVGRFGGDEYVVFLYHQESYSAIEEKANMTLQLINKIKVEENYNVSSSLGICFVNDEENQQELFDKADKALYYVKNTGKNKFQVYNEGMNKK